MTAPEIAEALTNVARTARRTVAFDHLGRINPVWDRLHARIDELLTEWATAPPPCYRGCDCAWHSGACDTDGCECGGVHAT